MDLAKFDALDNLFKELVPMYGKAESLAGEIVRAASRIGYRFVNDGDMIGVGYGKETCNPAARFLLKHGGNYVGALVRGLWEVSDESAYEAILCTLIPAVAEYVRENPNLRELPTEDMFDCRNPDEDLYDGDWEEDEYDDYMDET